MVQYFNLLQRFLWEDLSLKRWVGEVGMVTPFPAAELFQLYA